MKKMMYIASLGHSGSTVLDLTMGCHPQVYGLGEISEIINADNASLLKKEFNEITCSCGRNLYNCCFWSKVKNDFLKKNPPDKKIKIKQIMNNFSNMFGPDAIPLDSSKNSYAHLQRIHDLHSDILYTIFLVRDVRSYTYSRQSVKGGNSMRWAMHWYKENRKLKSVLDRINARYITIGYEEFALYPEFILKKICTFINIAFHKDMLVPHKSKSHIMRGNVMRRDSRMTQGILYDARWFTSIKNLLLSPFLLPIIKWNNQHVYSNIITGHKEAYKKKQADFHYFSNHRKEISNKNVEITVK